MDSEKLMLTVQDRMTRKNTPNSRNEKNAFARTIRGLCLWELTGIFITLPVHREI